jgi:Leucine-rich repeat (LRR) protein
LTLLAIDRNLISSLPREIGSLVNLEILTAAKNKLTSLPSLRSLRSLKQIDLRDNLLPASVSVSIVNDVRKTQALLETIDMLCEDKSSFSAAPSAPLSAPSAPLSSPRGPSRVLPTPPRSAPGQASLSRSLSGSVVSELAQPESVEDVQRYFKALGASEESIELLRNEQVDGSALRLFSANELRDLFKLSLGVLKKHEELSGELRKSSNGNNNNNNNHNGDGTNEREMEEAERRRDVAEREAEDARRLADRNAESLEFEHKRRVQAERELSDAKRFV